MCAPLSHPAQLMFPILVSYGGVLLEFYSSAWALADPCNQRQQYFHRTITANEFAHAPACKNMKQLASSQAGCVVARAALLFCLRGASAN